MITPDSNGESEIGEKGWTDEARAAALAARRALSGKAARADAQTSAKRLMDERRRVMAAHKAASASSHPLDQRLAKMHADKLAAIDRVGAKLAPKVRSPRKEAIKSAGRAAGRFLKRLFVREAEGDTKVLRFVEALVVLVEGTDLHEANYATLMERWSDAARAAALAARRAKKRGQNWKAAGRRAFLDALPASEQARLRRGEASPGDKKLAAKWAGRYASKPGSRVARGMQQEFERERGERKAARFAPRPKQPQALRDLWASQ